MNKKVFVRLLCALLTVLTLVAIVPATAISASAYELQKDYGKTNARWTKGTYENEAEYYNEMTVYYSNDTYELRCDETAGVVAYRNKLTGETLWTNPWNVNDGVSGEVEPGKGQSDLQNEQDKLPKDFGDEKNTMLSQIVLKYEGSGGGTIYSYSSAAKEGQIAVVPIKNGVRVEYAIGPLSPRILAPEMIEATSFEKNILEPLKEGLIAEYGKSDGTWYFNKFKSYFNFQKYTTEEREDKKQALANKYPVLAEKNIDIYTIGADTLKSKDTMRDQIEKQIKKYTSYTLEMMDEDYDYLNYESEDTAPPVFKMALEYVIDGTGLSVTLPANGLRYDESAYKITELWVLPYMGASLCTNEGYSFVADGSGALFDLDTFDTKSWYVYGDDFALQDESDGGNLHTKNHQIMRMPVYGQVETIWKDAQGKVVTKAEYQALEDKTGYTSTSRGYVAIIEEGDSLAMLELSQLPGVNRHSLLKTRFTTRQKDKFEGGWSSFATRRYTDNYSIRYIMLSDDTKAQQAQLSSYYECSWMGMAFAYRDYLDSKDNGFERLTSADVTDNAIPLYIETFGCMDTIEKILSMPVTVSKALTTFDDVANMYDYLCANGVKNVNFKLTGYANGGLYSDVPYKLDWESSVGGKSGFEDLIEKAKADGFGVYPDFDFVYTTSPDGGNKVNMKKHAARTIFNRYTTKRAYSSTYQVFISHYQMVMSPSTYAHFYEKLSKSYAKYGATGISLGTFGSALNSDYDEEKLSLREDSKAYIMQGLEYFKNQNYSVMVDAGNAFTWGYVDHIMGVPLDSSRYSKERTAVPFSGVVLHGYKEFASTALNKEGNLSYAMLKAMESGASIYFVLSYANTQLLKEDEVLSQNYSVRYDIWQERLVEIYLELNNVLADVQTKLIVNHEVLNLDASTNTIRIPDQDELLKDIEAEAQKKQQEIEEKIERERLAKLEAIKEGRKVAQNGALELPKHVLTVRSVIDNMVAQLNAWKGAVEALPIAVAAEEAAIEAEEDAIEAENAAIAAENAAIAAENAAIEAEENASEIEKDAATAAREIATAERETATAERETATAAREVASEARAAATVAKEVAQTRVSNALHELKLGAVEQHNLVETELRLAAGDILAARAGYDFLLTNGVTAKLVDEAKQNLTLAIKSYAELLSLYNGTTYTDVDPNADPNANKTWTEKWLELGGVPTIRSLQQIICGEDDLSLKTYNDIKAEATEIAAEMDVSLADKLAMLPATATYTAIEIAPVVIESTQSTSVNNYKVDNNVVAVTYGESKNDVSTYTKTILLNFNDYTIYTTYYNKVTNQWTTYTIAAYDYVVITY